MKTIEYNPGMNMEVVPEVTELELEQILAGGSMVVVLASRQPNTLQQQTRLRDSAGGLVPYFVRY